MPVREKSGLGTNNKLRNKGTVKEKEKFQEIDCFLKNILITFVHDILANLCLNDQMIRFMEIMIYKISIYNINPEPELSF